MDRNLHGPRADHAQLVASREGGVDRNESPALPWLRGGVASREGGVDRNALALTAYDVGSVASREGGVDRNTGLSQPAGGPLGRLPRGGRGSQLVVCRVYTDGGRRLPRGGRGSQPHDTAGSDQAGGRLPRGGRGSQHPEGSATARRDVASREGGVDRNMSRPPGSGGARASPPARGAWIATFIRSVSALQASRLPRGGRGSQLLDPVVLGHARGRLPRGGRGSQPVGVDDHGGRAGSPPARGAWIANTVQSSGSNAASRSPPARGAWIATMRDARSWSSTGSRLPRGGRGSQHVRFPATYVPFVSPPARGAWIATIRQAGFESPASVASREGGVDRNRDIMYNSAAKPVASREGGVDRNSRTGRRAAAHRVFPVRDASRLPRGGRGSQRRGTRTRSRGCVSPPARGAWIATSP